MKELIIKIRALFQGDGFRAAANEVRKTGDAADRAGGKLGGLRGSLGSCIQIAGGLGGAVAGVTTALLGMVGGGILAGVQALVGSFRQAMASAAEAQSAALKLNQALANTGQFSKSASDSIQELATAQQAATNISDEVWLEAAGKLLQFGAAAEDIPQYFEVIEGLAGRMGGDVAAATEAFARAMQGGRTELVKFGYDVDKNATKAEKFAEAQRIAATGSGMLRAETQTLGGSWTSLLVAGGDLLENLGLLINAGNWLSNTLKGMATAVGWVAKAFGGMPDATQKLVKNRSEAERGTVALDDMAEAAEGAADSSASIGDAAPGIANTARQAKAAATAFSELATNAATASEATDNYVNSRRDRALGANEANPMLDDEQKAGKAFEINQQADQTLLKDAEKTRDTLKAGYDAAFVDAADKDAAAAEAAATADAAKASLVDKSKQVGWGQGENVLANPAQAQEEASALVESTAAALAKAQERNRDGDEMALRRGTRTAPEIDTAPLEAAAAGAKQDLALVQDLAAEAKKVAELEKAAAEAKATANAAQANKTATIAEADPKITAANERIANLKAKLDVDAAKRKQALAEADEKKRIVALERTDKLERIYAQTRIEQMEAAGAKDDQIAAQKRKHLDAEYARTREIALAKKEDTSEIDANYDLQKAQLARQSLNDKEKQTGNSDSARNLDPRAPKGIHRGLRGEILRNADGSLGEGVTESALGVLEGPSRLPPAIGPQALRTPRQQTPGQDGTKSETQAVDTAGKAVSSTMKEIATTLKKQEGEAKQTATEVISAVNGIQAAFASIRKELNKMQSQIKNA